MTKTFIQSFGNVLKPKFSPNCLFSGGRWVRGLSVGCGYEAYRKDSEVAKD